MHFEDSFGVRQSPSIAEAMRQTPQLGQQWVYSSSGSTPNTYMQTGIKSNIGSSSQQLMEPILRCSPAMIDPVYNSQPQNVVSSFDQNLDEIEKKLCTHLDETLKINYKKMKNKIKKVKSRVQQTDNSIRRIHELIETVYEHIDEIENLRNPFNNSSTMVHESTPNNNIKYNLDDGANNSNCRFQNQPSKKITWRRGFQNKIIESSEL